MTEDGLCLNFFDKAILYEKERYRELYLSDSMYKFFVKSINNLSKKGLEKIPEELVKTQTEIAYLREAISFLKECMVYYGRKKIVDVSVEMVHIVPENYKVKIDPIFGGIVVERTKSDLFNALVAARKISKFMFFRTVMNNKDRKFFLYETGSSWRESVSDYLSRRFYEEKIVKDKILKDIFIFEECFSSEGEAFLKDAVKDVFERSQGLFSKEEILNDIINNVINGTISPYVYLDKKEVEVLISNKNLKVRIFQKENE